MTVYRHGVSSGVEVDNCGEMDRTYRDCGGSSDARCIRNVLHHSSIPQVTAVITRLANCYSLAA